MTRYKEAIARDLKRLANNYYCSSDPIVIEALLSGISRNLDEAKKLNYSRLEKALGSISEGEKKELEFASAGYCDVSRALMTSSSGIRPKCVYVQNWGKGVNNGKGYFIFDIIHEDIGRDPCLTDLGDFSGLDKGLSYDDLIIVLEKCGFMR